MKTKRFLSLLLSLVMALSLTVPAFAAEGIDPAYPEVMPVVLPDPGEEYANEYDAFVEQFISDYTAAHAEEYAAFDTDAWFAENWYYWTKEEYLESFNVDEADFKDALWEEYLSPKVAKAYDAKRVEDYRAAHPGELEALDVNELLAQKGYVAPMEMYMRDWGLDTEEAVISLLTYYIQVRRGAEERRARAEAYRAEDPESWAGFDVEAYFEEEYGWWWNDKEGFMQANDLYTEEEFAEYLYVMYMDDLTWTPWRPDVTLVVNGEPFYESGIYAEGGVSFLPVDELNAILGTALEGDRLGIRAAAEAAGWDVTWNSWRNQVVLLDKAKLTKGFYDEKGAYSQQSFAKLDKLVKWMMEASKMEEGKAYRTTETVTVDATLFNTLDGDESYTLDLTVDTLVKDRVYDVTVTANLAQLMELLPKEVLDRLAYVLPKFTFQNLKTALTGCKIQMLFNMDTGALYVNAPLLALFDDSVDADTWYSFDFSSVYNEENIAAAFAMVQDLDMGELLYSSLLENSATNHWGATDAYGDFVEQRTVLAAVAGDKAITESGDTLTWKLNAQGLDEVMKSIGPWMEDADKLFKELDMTLTVKKNGEMSLSAVVRPNSEAMTGEYGRYYYYDFSDYIFNQLMDFRYTAEAKGNPDHAEGALEFHWKNLFKVEMKMKGDRKPSETAPRTAPPAGANIVKI